MIRRNALACAFAIAVAVFAGIPAQSVRAAEPAAQAVTISARLIAAAEKDGEVNLSYNYQLDQMQAIIAAFNRTFPHVKVIAERKPGAPGAYALEQELAVGVNRIDVFQGTDLAANADLISKGAFAALRPPNLADFPKAALAMAPYLYYPETVTAVVAYNPAFVSESEAKLLMQWRGILDPRFKGKISLVEPALGVTQGVLNYIMNTPGLGSDFLTKLKAQQPNIYPNAVPARDALVSGQKPIIWGSVWDAIAIQDIEKGSPLRFVYTNPAIQMTGSGFGVLAKAPHPNAARLFWAWMLGRNAALAIQGPDSNMRSILAGIKDTRPAMVVVNKGGWYVAPRSLWTPETDNWIKNGPTFRSTWDDVMLH
jgi:iron(III) transport system substrate-binding protein